MTVKRKRKDKSPSPAEREDHRLEQGVLFRLILSVALIAKPFIEHHAKRHDLTLNEWRAMMVLASRPGLCGEDVANTLSIERMTASRVLRRMQSAGYTERRQPLNDRKRSCWFLAAGGWEVFDEIAPRAIDRQDHVLQGLTGPQKKALSAAIDSIIEHARDGEWPDA